MKGDFSRWGFDPAGNDTRVLHQQGRVLLDADWNAAGDIEVRWRETMARDTIGSGVFAVPASVFASFRVTSAKVDGDHVAITLEPGRGWADGVHVVAPSNVANLPASWLPVPVNAAGISVADVKEGARDAVLLEVWEESVSAFEEPAELLEPALGGVDTTERARACMALRLVRLDDDEGCAEAAARARDDLSKRGRLTVTPQPALVIAGDCPVEAGGGYTGLEHALYRIEIGEPKAGRARFKWSRFNGGLVGRGRQVSPNHIRIEANRQAIEACGLPGFYLEAYRRDAFGTWQAVFGASAVPSQQDELVLTPDYGTWPGASASDSVFFRLWDGIAEVKAFPDGPADPAELEDGIRLAFDAAAADLSNYRTGDYWTFPVRAAGVGNDPSKWPDHSPPEGVVRHRVALGIVEWRKDATATRAGGDIDDCRRVFRPLTRQGTCCTYVVGDGQSTHGDFDSIQEAVDALPKAGGQICLLPGLHTGGVVIDRRRDVTIHGCGVRTKIVPPADRADDPLFLVTDSRGVLLVSMDMATLAGTAIVIRGSKAGGASHVEVRDNRILAGEVGVRVDNGAAIGIRDNRIRMLDRDGAGVGIYLQADDSVVERNELTVLPALRTPDLDITEDSGGNVRPTDDCARFGKVYRQRSRVRVFLERVWDGVVLVEEKAPYRALSGIQVAAGSERVRVADNTITGGAGDGIALGSLLVVTVPPADDAEAFFVTITSETVAGVVAYPDGTEAAGVQLAFTNVETGEELHAVTSTNGGFVATGPKGRYEVTVVTPGIAIGAMKLQQYANFSLYLIELKEAESNLDELFAFLYDVRIERNRIAGMGLSGIGIAPLPAEILELIAARKGVQLSPLILFLVVYGNPVIGLAIADNRITGCLRNPFEGMLRDVSQLRGVGGVSLGLVEDVSITGNQIEGNGTSHVDPVCGVFVAIAEELSIEGNRIAGNGPLVASSDATKLQPGMRGGVVVGLASATSVAGAFTSGAAALTASQRPAARIHHNVVDQPAGQALTLLAFGPVAVTDNSLSSELSGPRAVDRVAGTVLLFNLGGVQSLGGGTDLATDTASITEATTLSVRRRAYAEFEREEFVYRVMPGGYTRFDGNQVRTGAWNTSRSCQFIVSLDDLSYQGNQAMSYRTGALFANAYLGGATVRACGNRLAERGEATQMSLYSLAVRMNDTSLNQGDHCIVSTDMNAAMPEVHVGNQVLNPGALCRSLNMISDLMFKAKG